LKPDCELIPRLRRDHKLQNDQERQRTVIPIRYENYARRAFVNCALRCDNWGIATAAIGLFRSAWDR